MALELAKIAKLTLSAIILNIFQSIIIKLGNNV